MSSFDLLVLLVIVVSGLLGWHRGGIRELVTLVAIAAGFLALSLFGATLSAAVPGTLQKLIVLIAIFVAADALVLLAGGYLVRRFAGAEKKRGDRIAGGVFGLVRGWVLAAFVLFTIGVYHSGTELPQAIQRSAFAPALSGTVNAFLRNADVRVSGLSNRSRTAISPIIDISET